MSKVLANDSLSGLDDSHAWSTIARVNSQRLLPGDQCWSQFKDIDESGEHRDS